jgi:hypothetical protein
MTNLSFNCFFKCSYITTNLSNIYKVETHYLLLLPQVLSANDGNLDRSCVSNDVFIEQHSMVIQTLLTN